MNLLVKLDGTVVSDENVKLQRGIQVGTKKEGEIYISI